MSTSEEFTLFERLKQRMISYRLAKSANFDKNQSATQEMLIDLSRFARMGETPCVLDTNGTIDRDKTFVMIGRQEVIQRIQNHLNLSTQQLYRIYTGQSFNPEGD